MQNFFSWVNGKLNITTGVSKSAGVADAGKIILLGTNGMIDPSMYSAGGYWQKIGATNDIYYDAGYVRCGMSLQTPDILTPKMCDNSTDTRKIDITSIDETACFIELYNKTGGTPQDVGFFLRADWDPGWGKSWIPWVDKDDAKFKLSTGESASYPDAGGFSHDGRRTSVQFAFARDGGLSCNYLSPTEKWNVGLTEEPSGATETIERLRIIGTQTAALTMVSVGAGNQAHWLGDAGYSWFNYGDSDREWLAWMDLTDNDWLKFTYGDRTTHAKRNSNTMIAVDKTGNILCTGIMGKPSAFGYSQVSFIPQTAGDNLFFQVCSNKSKDTADVGVLIDSIGNSWTNWMMWMTPADGLLRFTYGQCDTHATRIANTKFLFGKTGILSLSGLTTLATLGDYHAFPLTTDADTDNIMFVVGNDLATGDRGIFFRGKTWAKLPTLWSNQLDGSLNFSWGDNTTHALRVSNTKISFDNLGNISCAGLNASKINPKKFLATDISGNLIWANADGVNYWQSESGGIYYSGGNVRVAGQFIASKDGLATQYKDAGADFYQLSLVSLVTDSNVMAYVGSRTVTAKNIVDSGLIFLNGGNDERFTICADYSANLLRFIWAANEAHSSRVFNSVATLAQDGTFKCKNVTLAPELEGGETGEIDMLSEIFTLREQLKSMKEEIKNVKRGNN